jgi:hypothetical protein
LALLAFLSAAKATREKASAKKWKERAITAAESGVEDSIASTSASLSQAKLHDARAIEADKKTKARLDQMGTRNESMADIVDGWRKPKPD